MCLNNEKGLGLIELIVTTIVMAFIVLGTFSFQINMNQISNQSDAKYQMQTQGNLTLNYVNRYLEAANCNLHQNGTIGCLEDNPSTTCSNGGNRDTNGGYNDIMITTPADGCENSGAGFCTTSAGPQYRFWAILTPNLSNTGYIYMQQTGQTQQTLVGDYNDGKFRIKAVQFATEKNSNIRTAEVTIKLGLFDGNDMIESMRFVSAVRPRNQL